MRDIQIQAVAVESIVDLRHRVLRDGLPREAAYFSGDYDEGTVHLASFLGDEVIGCATLLRSVWQNEPASQLRGMAVAAEHQRSGVGTMLLLEAQRQAREAGAKVVWANCRTSALGFYRRFGWEVASEEFVIETAGPHFKMVKALNNAKKD